VALAGHFFDIERDKSAAARSLADKRRIEKRQTL